ncbi:MAG: polysaccharide deacetylase family protein [Melioribacteraceae bacterium]|nr:polysaccharide deacetylase family protein [Melioribacteraceae bacterium]MCF8263322.1 polysaccharide deacetylase family protein [Melioribacteraceae bacterium]MCF8431982.1 polysaccharide deacetylase family protein [Melioribacteraceae bacterium]
MKLKLLLLLLLLALYTINGQPKKFMSVTFDDLPLQQAGKFSSEQIYEINSRLISHIAKYEIPAVGFVNEGKIFMVGNRDELKIDVLKMWLDSGLELGNHTYSHADVNRVPFNEYRREILKGEIITRPLAEKRGLKYEYFRHPYLRAGATQELKDSLNNFLSAQNYKIAPVTIDNSEWIFNAAYTKAFFESDSILMSKIGKEYVDYMIKKIGYYEDQSSKFFGREIKHILLVHANLLNSDYFDELASAILDVGYQFTTLDETLTDPVYNSKDGYIGKYGPSWIHRWALAMGFEGKDFSGEPRTPKYIKEYAGIEYE